MQDQDLLLRLRRLFGQGRVVPRRRFRSSDLGHRAMEDDLVLGREFLDEPGVVVL